MDALFKGLRDFLTSITLLHSYIHPGASLYNALVEGFFNLIELSVLLKGNGDCFL
jgi:hypothetical protein